MVVGGKRGRRARNQMRRLKGIQRDEVEEEVEFRPAHEEAFRPVMKPTPEAEDEETPAPNKRFKLKTKNKRAKNRYRRLQEGRYEKANENTTAIIAKKFSSELPSL